MATLPPLSSVILTRSIRPPCKNCVNTAVPLSRLLLKRTKLILSWLSRRPSTGELLASRCWVHWVAHVLSIPSPTFCYWQASRQYPYALLMVLQPAGCCMVQGVRLSLGRPATCFRYFHLLQMPREF